MVRDWPALVQRVRVSPQALGEVMLGVLLVAVLASAWRDGVPSDGYVGPSKLAVRVPAAPAEVPSFGLTLPGLRDISSWAVAQGALGAEKSLIPTAPPAQLLIPLLRVHRAVEKVGVNRSGVMNEPVNGWNAGWYVNGPIPGAPGDAVIEGHAGYPGQPMIFGRLATLKRGDPIIVVLADGSQRLFRVVSMTSVPVGSAPAGLGEQFGPPRLTLITCTGSFDATNYSYSRRLVVEASYAGIL